MGKTRLHTLKDTPGKHIRTTCWDAGPISQRSVKFLVHARITVGYIWGIKFGIN